MSADAENPWRVAAVAEGTVIVSMAGYIVWLHAQRIKDLLLMLPVVQSCRDVLTKALEVLR